MMTSLFSFQVFAVTLQTPGVDLAEEGARRREGAIAALKRYGRRAESEADSVPGMDGQGPVFQG